MSLKLSIQSRKQSTTRSHNFIITRRYSIYIRTSPGDNIELEDDSDIIQEDSSALDLQEQVLIKATDNTNSDCDYLSVESVINTFCE